MTAASNIVTLGRTCGPSVQFSTYNYPQVADFTKVQYFQQPPDSRTRKRKMTTTKVRVRNRPACLALAASTWIGSYFVPLANLA